MPKYCSLLISSAVYLWVSEACCTVLLTKTKVIKDLKKREEEGDTWVTESFQG